MADQPSRADDAPHPSSSPCFSRELDRAYVDPQQATDVARWRRAERQRLLAERAALSVADRSDIALAITTHLEGLLSARFGSLQGASLSAWWPIKAELDLRPWLARLAAGGVRVVLPVVVEKSAPLKFRPWSPDCRMERGVWNILVPAEGPEVDPDICLAPVVGWDRAGFRLGYGGGYFDRTLAALYPRPFTIGVGMDTARIDTIFPQPHDMAMDMIVTESGADGGR